MDVSIFWRWSLRRCGRGAHLALLALFALVSSASASPEPTSEAPVTAPVAAAAAPTPSQAADIVDLATTVDKILNDRSASPPPNNTYSHEMAYDPSQLSVPRIYLKPGDSYSALSSTDCSGWVAYLVNAVSPLHHAVLQSQRNLPAYNQTYEDGFQLNESTRPWPRAFVLTNYFRSEYASSTGFERLGSHETIRAGDLAAYSLGRYVDPGDSSLAKPPDTGHTFVIMGPTEIVDPETPGYDGNGTLSDRAVRVIAAPIIDSSSVPHFDPDSRKGADGGFLLPPRLPYAMAKAGGIGSGTAWFAVDENNRVIQRRLGPEATFSDVTIGAVRLRNLISLEPEILDEEGYLSVDVFENAPTELSGAAYGRLPISLSGNGGIRLIRGRLVLGGDSNFKGGVVIEGGDLVVESETGLGYGDVEVRGGTLTMSRAAIGDGANLRLAQTLRDDAVRLAFEEQDVLQSLQIGDKTFRCGTWGSFESDAAFTDPRFAGPGVLFLRGEPSADCKAPGHDPSIKRKTAPMSN